MAIVDKKISLLLEKGNNFTNPDIFLDHVICVFFASNR